MKILKNIFLLIILFVFASSLFIATQNGTYSISRSRIISLPKTTIFNYVNDYKNWESFGSWNNNNSDITFLYPKNSIGIGAYYSWKGNNDSGTMKTIFVKENQSLYQKMNFNGTLSNVYWTFKDTLGGTKVVWKSNGKMDFGFKIYAIFNGGVEKIIGSIYEKSLLQLDKKLHFEIATYSIKINGKFKKLGTYYLNQTITSTLANSQKNIRIMLANNLHLFKKNNMIIHGKPFVIYYTINSPKGITQFSLCIPTKELVFTRSGSQVTSGELVPFQAIKTTLIGDYSHNKEAWDKTYDYCKKNNLVPDSQISPIEVYILHATDIASPSKWVTEIYIPIKNTVNVVKVPESISELQTIPTEKSIPKVF